MDAYNLPGGANHPTEATPDNPMGPQNPHPQGNRPRRRRTILDFASGGRSPGVAPTEVVVVPQPATTAAGVPTTDMSAGGTTTTTTAQAASVADCNWCRYGKPAAAGAAIGAVLAMVVGEEWTRGALWGGVGGLLYGQVRG